MIQKFLVVRDCTSGCRKNRHTVLRKGLELELNDELPNVAKWKAKGWLKVINDADILHNDNAVKADNDQ